LLAALHDGGCYYVAEIMSLTPYATCLSFAFVENYDMTLGRD